jgi:hypothetical protein
MLSRTCLAFAITLLFATVLCWVSSWFWVQRVFIGGQTANHQLRQHLLESAQGQISFRFWLSSELEAGKGPIVKYTRVSRKAAGPLQAFGTTGTSLNLIAFRLTRPLQSGPKIYVIAVPYWFIIALEGIISGLLLYARRIQKPRFEAIVKRRLAATDGKPST